MKLTQTAISKLTLGQSEEDKIWFDDDLPRFGVRVRKGGSRKFVIHYRQGGIQRRYTIGSVATLTLDEARQRARKVLVAIDDGRDPASENAAKRAAVGLIFGAVMRDYLGAVSLKPNTLVGVTYHLEKLWKPLHKLPLGAVDRQMVAAHLRVIAKDNGNVSANRARGSLSAFYAWSIGEGLAETNPVIGTNQYPTKPRDRVLSGAELAAIWKAAPENDYGRIVRLLMLTGQRRDEIGGLRWSEIDTEARQITLSGDRTKNGQQHQVPLCNEAMAILETCFHRSGRDFIFGDGANGYAGWSKGKTALDNACGVKDWTVHDLRRSAATGMADVGVQPHVIEAILNHVSGHKAGVAGIYNRSTYVNEKRAALDLWGRHVEALLSGRPKGVSVRAVANGSVETPRASFAARLASANR